MPAPTEKVNSLIQIRSHLLTLSTSERTVAEWILQNKEQVLYLSMSEIAQACKVSDTTVLRMCRNIGYRGFTDLKISMAQDLASPTQLIHDEVSEGDDPATIARKVFLSNIQSLYDTLALLEEQTLLAAVEQIESARHILICGVGGSALVAQSLYQKLYRLGLHPDAPADVQVQIMHAALLEKGDLAIGISYSGITQDVALALREARGHGAATLCITGNRQSPIAKECDVALMSVSHETRSDALAARVAQMTLVDALYVLYSTRHLESTLAAEKRVVNSIIPKSY